MSTLSRLAVAANCACAICFAVAAYMTVAAPVPDSLFSKPTQWASMTLQFSSPRAYAVSSQGDVTITISRDAFFSTQVDHASRYYNSYNSDTGAYYKKAMTVRFGQKEYDIDISKLDQQLREGSLYFSHACIQKPTDGVQGPANREGYKHLVVIVPWKHQYRAGWKLVKFYGDYGGYDIIDYTGSDGALSKCSY